MKVCDLVKHKGFGSVYLVVAFDKKARNMVGILEPEMGIRQWVARNWLEVVSESR